MIQVGKEKAMMTPAKRVAVDIVKYGRKKLSRALKMEASGYSRKIKSAFSDGDDYMKRLIDFCLDQCYRDKSAKDRITCMRGKRFLAPLVYSSLAQMKSEACEVFIAGGFASYVFSNTRTFGDIDVYLIGSKSAQDEAISKFQSHLSSIKKGSFPDSEGNLYKVHSTWTDYRRYDREYNNKVDLMGIIAEVMWIEIFALRDGSRRIRDMQRLTVNFVQMEYSEPSEWRCQNIAKIIDNFDLDICRAVLWDIGPNGPNCGVRFDQGLGFEKTASVVFKEKIMLRGIVKANTKNEPYKLRALDTLIRKCKKYEDAVYCIARRCRRYRMRCIVQRNPQRLEHLCLGKLCWKMSGDRLLHHVFNLIT